MALTRLGAAGWRSSFHRLRWRLTIRYTLFTVAAILILEILSLMAVRTFLPHAIGNPGKGFLAELDRAAGELAPLLARVPPDRAAIEKWLEEGRPRRRFPPFPAKENSGEKRTAARPIWAVIDADGRLVAADPSPRFLPDESLRVDEAIAAVLGGRAVPSARTGRAPDGRVVAAVPVAEGGRVLGALVSILPGPRGAGAILLQVLSLRNAGLIVLVAGLVGAVFGLFTGRWLTRRLRSLAVATEAWGRGDFSVTAKDEGEDEIGELARRLNRMAREIQDLLHDRAQLAVVEERNRLARDLHDSVTQAIYSLNLYGEAASRLLAAGDFQTAAAHLAEIRIAAQRALKEMRLLVFALRPPALEQEGLVAALQARLEAVEARAGLRVEFHAEGVERLAPAVEEGLYRIAQEALNNALKHAQASRVRVDLRREGESVLMEIADDGVGFDPGNHEGQGGLGLSGMAERAERMGARFAIESLPGGGTIVRVEVKA